MDIQFNRGEGRKLLPDPARQLAEEIAWTIPPSLVVFNPGYRAARFIRAGLLLGGLAGCTSLLLNVIGSVLWPSISGEWRNIPCEWFGCTSPFLWAKRRCNLKAALFWPWAAFCIWRPA